MVRLPLKAVTSVEQLGHLLVFVKLKQRKHPHPPPLKTHTSLFIVFRIHVDFNEDRGCEHVMAVIQPRRHPCDSHGEPGSALRPGRDSLPGPSSSSAWHTPINCYRRMI